MNKASALSKLQRASLEAVRKFMTRDQSKDWTFWYDFLNDSGAFAYDGSIVLANAKQRDAYENILRCRSLGVELETPIYHCIPLSYFQKAVVYGGFVLIRPRKWNDSEDLAFKNICYENGDDKDYLELAEKVYETNTYSMCWTLDAENKSVLEMEAKNHPNEPIVIINSTVRSLLNAYINDKWSILSCSIVKMRYLNDEYLNKYSFKANSLRFPSDGTELHHASISQTSARYASQNEVRLIFENQDGEENKPPCKGNVRSVKDGRMDLDLEDSQFVKHVDLRLIIHSLRVVPGSSYLK